MGGDGMTLAIEIYDYVYRNPGCTSAKIVAAVKNEYPNRANVTAKLKTMCDRGDLSREQNEDGVYIYTVKGVMA